MNEYYNNAFTNGREPASPRDKLFGWPAWVQGYYDVPCPDCGEPMPALLQIASEDNIPYMFGDCGIGHVFLCPHHPARACFDWSCF